MFPFLLCGVSAYVLHSTVQNSHFCFALLQTIRHIFWRNEEEIQFFKNLPTCLSFPMFSIPFEGPVCKWDAFPSACGARLPFLIVCWLALLKRVCDTEILCSPLLWSGNVFISSSFPGVSHWVSRPGLTVSLQSCTGAASWPPASAAPRAAGEGIRILFFVHSGCFSLLFSRLLAVWLGCV